MMIRTNEMIKRTFITVLWALFSLPLIFALLNAYRAVNPVMDTIPEPIIVPMVEDVIEESSKFIWETEDTFEEAFSLARSLLGPNATFVWQDSLYHTNFKNEFTTLD